MAKPTQSKLDQAVEESMILFSRARTGGAVTTIEPRRLSAVLLVLDGSSQDTMGMAVVEQFRERFDCQVAVADTREDVSSDELVREVAQSLGAVAVPKTEGESYEQILAAVDQSKCDLLITPCPYGRDLESVGPDSAGTVIDVLLARSRVPILVVRKPYEPQGDFFGQVLMILTAENEAAPAAAAWAAGLMAPGGLFQLVLVLEREMYENVHALMQSIAPDVDVSAGAVSQALAKAHMQLHRGLQDAAAELGFDYRLRLQLEGEAGSLDVEDDSMHPLIVLALERSDHASQGSVQNRIRLSPNLVLVVCRG